MSTSRIHDLPRRRRRLTSSPVLAAALAAALLSTLPAAAGDRLNLGCVLSLSGPQAFTAALYRKAAELTAEEVNSRGGVRVGERRVPLAIKYVDDGGNPGRTGPLAESLIDREGVDFLLGAAAAAQTSSVAAVASRRGVPMVQGSSSASAPVAEGGPWSFGTLPGPSDWLTPAVPFLRALVPPPATVAVVGSEEDGDRETAAGFSAAARDAGLRVVAEETYPPGARDLRDVIRQLGRAAPEVVVFAGYEEDTRLFLRQAREGGLSPRLVLVSAGVGEQRFVKSLGEDGEGLCGVAPWSPSAEYGGDLFGSAVRFGRLWKERHGEDPDHRVAAAAAAVVALVAAVERAGTTEGRAVRDALAAMDMPTVFGTLSFHPDGRRRGGTRVVQVQKGKAVTVYPPGGARPVYPVERKARP